MTQVQLAFPTESVTKFEAAKRRGSTVWEVGERDGLTIIVEVYTGVTNSYGEGTGKRYFARISNKAAEQGEGYQVFQWLPFEDKTILTGEAPKRYSQKGLEAFHQEAIAKAVELAGTTEVQEFLAGKHIY